MSKHIRKPQIADPRIAVSKHIGWSKNAKDEMAFSIPEPNAYNYAICCDRPKVCHDLNFQIFYKLPKESKWWSLYCVEAHERDTFMQWLSGQDFDIYWSTRGGASIKKQMVSLF